jgi:hypothetical protein
MKWLRLFWRAEIVIKISSFLGSSNSLWSSELIHTVYSLKGGDQGFGKIDLSIWRQFPPPKHWY